MDLKEISKQINEVLENRRREIELSFIEEGHIYYMKDLDGIVKTTFPSVSTVIKKLHTPFDANAKSLQMCKGDKVAQEVLLNEWKGTADYSTNMGSRAHFILESELVRQYGGYKEVRQPIFDCDESQISTSDIMVEAGKQFLDLMHERGAILLDTEMVLGDPEYGYTGQPDKTWIMFNKLKTDFGFVITDWKTNQPKNFIPQWYNGWMKSPLNKYRDTALSHYYAQLPLYGKLILKMLKGTKFENLPFMGSVIVLLKNDGTFVEYKVPQDVHSAIMNMNIKKILK